MEKLAGFTRKKALNIVLIFSIAIFLLILARWLLAYSNENTGLATLDGREKILNELGWEIDRDSEEYHSISLPAEPNPVLEEYNQMQLAQGYDMSRYFGEKCEQYTYRVTNYPAQEDNVYVTIYIHGRKLIAGDIHSNSLTGFMHGIIKENDS